MPIIGTNLTKLEVERKNPAGKITVNNNINIKDVQEMNLALGDLKQDGVRFVFEYTSEYLPDAASMKFTGEVMYLGEKKEVDGMLKNWKDKKPIDSEVMVAVMNSALTKGTVTALMLAQDMNLPSPVKLPRVQAKKE
tara:strand:+ start:158 stop:568 length:411 start_codon:yes stop_codon:yes gene_type:complete